MTEGVGPGSYLSPGEVFLKIVPAGAALVARIRINPRDVGRIRVGQPAQVRVSAYDFVRYGTVNGTLTYLSPASFTDAEGRVYFAGEITFEAPYVGDDPANRVMAGMTVEANIANGERSLLSYVMSPVKLALERAFRES